MSQDFVTEATFGIDATPAAVDSADNTGYPGADRLPWFALLLFSAMGFILLSAETMPAGLLPVIAAGMNTSEGVVGQFVSVWALGTVLLTIPAIAFTRSHRRKPVLVSAITVLIVANTVTALSDAVALSLASRFVAGACTGIIWGTMAAYAARISPARYAGRSLSIVSTGAPLGFAFGTPLGSWLGTTFSWRWSFGGLTVLAVVVLVLVVLVVPDAAGQAAAARMPLRRVVAIPGVMVILAVIVAWMLAHNTIYTYIAPYLHATGTGLSAGVVLFIYGVASLGGIALTAAFLDRRPRELLHLSAVGFVAAAVILLVGHASSVVIVIAAVLWGMTFGGASTQMQAALTRVSGENSVVANSFLPVAFNVAIFAAGLLGAGLLTYGSGLSLAAVMTGLGVVTVLLTFYGRPTAFTA
jgi:predicted MFS family arabinose efflux permease